MNTDRHRIRLHCDDGCSAVLELRLDGTRHAEAHRAALRALLQAIATADGWKGDRCPTCRRWNEPATCPTCKGPAGRDCTLGRCKEPATGAATVPVLEAVG